MTIFYILIDVQGLKLAENVQPITNKDERYLSITKNIPLVC